MPRLALALAEEGITVTHNNHPATATQFNIHTSKSHEKSRGFCSIRK
jgi:hypothetical protein